jgi:hypothetical protein
MPKNRKQDSKGASWRETAEGRKTEKKQSWSFWPALNLGGWRRLALAPPIFPDFFLPQLRLSPPPLPLLSTRCLSPWTRNSLPAPRTPSARSPGSGAPGGRCSRCCRIEYAPRATDPRRSSQRQGYEVTEDEVQMPLDTFKAKYADPLGYPECVPSHPSVHP